MSKLDYVATTPGGRGWWIEIRTIVKIRGWKRWRHIILVVLPPRLLVAIGGIDLSAIVVGVVSMCDWMHRFWWILAFIFRIGIVCTRMV